MFDIINDAVSQIVIRPSRARLGESFLNLLKVGSVYTASLKFFGCHPHGVDTSSRQRNLKIHTFVD